MPEWISRAASSRASPVCIGYVEAIEHFEERLSNDERGESATAPGEGALIISGFPTTIDIFT